MKKIVAFIVFFVLTLSMAAVQAEETPEWINILLMGGDARSTEKYDRTDCMIILSVNHEARQLKMTSIMRDTYVPVANRNYSAKINETNVYGGPQLTIDTINMNFDAGIEDYILVNMNDLVEIIDLIGGVDVDVTSSERYYINVYAKDYLKNVASYDGETTLTETGVVHLNGLLAMSYCRNRYSDNDFNRVMRQQEVLLSLGKQVQESDFEDLLPLTDDILQHIETTLNDEEIKALAKLCMVIDVENVEQYRIPADKTYTTGHETYRIYPNLEKNIQLLKDFIYGTTESN